MNTTTNLTAEALQTAMDSLLTDFLRKMKPQPN